MKEKIIEKVSKNISHLLFHPSIAKHKKILEIISQALDEYAKPKCDKCFDKGYRTELKGVRDLGHNKEGKTYSDSSGEQMNTFTAMEFCNCDRGKELEIRVKEYADWKIKENDANWQAVVGYNCDNDTLQRIALAIKILANKDKK